MTLLPPFLPQSIRYGQTGYPDVEPFSIRSAASYEDIQYSIVTWIRDQLTPWIADTDLNTSTAVNALTDSVNAALAAQAATFAAQYGTFFMGAVVAPPPTGVIATDTANLLAAFATANSRHANLILSPSSDGTLRSYRCSSPLVWNLNRGSLVGQGHVSIDFSAVASNYQGAALTVTTNTDVSEGGHLSATHQVGGFTILGHDTDASMMDGLMIIQDPTNSIGNDQGTITSLQVLSFRDNLTFGINTWDFEFHKCSFAYAHRYNVNLTGGTGESQQFVGCDIYGAGAHNSSTATLPANIYSPAGQTVDVRFYGGSFDYPGIRANASGGVQGIFDGATNLTFDSVHIEDANTGPMFLYGNAQSGNVVDVTFINCYTTSTCLSIRDHIHEIKPSTNDRINLRFIADKGVAGTGHWVQDNSGLSNSQMSVTFDTFAVQNNGGLTPSQALLLAPFGTIGYNTRFDTSNSFATGTAPGWKAGPIGTWTIGTANARNGSCLQLVGDGTTGSNSATQLIRVPANKRPLRVSGYQQITGYTAGSVGLYVRFLAEDGTTVLNTGGDQRIGSDLSALSGWAGKTRQVIPPAGAAFILVMAQGINGFQGTAQWDDIEVVPL